MPATLPIDAAFGAAPKTAGNTRRVAAASLAGTTLEFYDHFI